MLVSRLTHTIIHKRLAMLFASFLGDACLMFLVVCVVLIWLAFKAAKSPTVQKGARELIVSLFRK